MNVLRAWPSWLRWCLTGVLAVLPVVVAYLIFALVAGVAPAIAAQAVGVLAAALGCGAFVYVGRAVAPSFRRYVALTLVAAIAIGAIYFMVTSSRLLGAPAGFVFLAGLAAIAGAICGCVARLGDPAEPAAGEIFGWMPAILRWCAFVPIALVASLLAAYELGFPLSLARFDGALIPIANAPVTAAVFVGVAAAVAPRGKKIVGIALAVLAALVVLVLFWTGLSAAVTRQTLPLNIGQRPDELALEITVWSQILTTAGAIAGLAIGAIAASRAERR